MSDNILFYVIFLSQILLISFYFPRKMYTRMKFMSEKYPPAVYPKLYPKGIEYFRKAWRNYKNMNLFILLAGLLLIAVLIGYPQSGEWDAGNIVFVCFMIQFIPVMLLEIGSFKYYKLMRITDPRSTRKAELSPRRLFDFVSPKLVGMAALVYIAFIVFVIYIRQFEYPWFGGYGNIAGVTLSSPIKKSTTVFLFSPDLLP